MTTLRLYLSMLGGLLAVNCAACASEPNESAARTELTEAVCSVYACGLDPSWTAECVEALTLPEWPRNWSGTFDACLGALVDMAAACPDERLLPDICRGLVVTP